MTALEQVILQTLQERPNLTSDQIAKVLEAKHNTIQVNLKRLVDKKLIYRKGVLNETQSGRRFVYLLKGQKALGEDKSRHDISVNDVWVKLKLLGMQILPRPTQKDGFREDLAFLYENKKFYLEVETGSQGKDTIKEKVERYLKIKGWFYVIFTVQDYYVNGRLRKSFTDNGHDILNVLEYYGRGAQFLITSHDNFLINPLGDELHTPSTHVFSLASLKAN